MFTAALFMSQELEISRCTSTDEWTDREQYLHMEGTLFGNTGEQPWQTPQPGKAADITCMKGLLTKADRTGHDSILWNTQNQSLETEGRLRSSSQETGRRDESGGKAVSSFSSGGVSMSKIQFWRG